jgi:uncharacterized glyoxalase superfamily protein PhnB
MATRRAKRSKPAAKKAPRRAAARRPAARKAPAGSRARRVRRSPETLRLRSVTPSLTVNDLEKSVRFYTEALGFMVGERWTDDKGVLTGVMLKAGACQVGLTQDDWAKGRDRVKGQGMSLWCDTVQDVDALAARVKAAGGSLAAAPKDEWGARRFAVDDPDGFRLFLAREKKR